MDWLFHQNVILYISAYLLASIPFGYLLAKFFAKVDVREAGSGNIGATNVLRVVKQQNPTLAKKLGIATIILDTLKGAFVILIAKYLGADDSVLWFIGVLSVFGHCFSLFLGFEGGKGVATSLGVMSVMIPIEAIIAVAVWAFFAKVVKISSLSSLIAVMSLIISSYIIHPEIPDIYSHAPIWIICMTIFYKHIPNIIRLFTRQEARV